MSPGRTSMESHAQFWTIVAGVVALITFLIAISRCGSDSAGNSNPSVPTASASGNVNPAPTGDGTTPAPASLAGAVTRFLSTRSLNDGQALPDEVASVNGFPSVREGPQDIRGVTYSRNVTFGLVCTDSSDKFLEYNLGGYFDRFTAVVGISDISKSRKYHFEVETDDRRVVNLTLLRGQSKKLSIPVANVLRLRLSACSIDESPILEDRTGGVFGDAAVTGSSAKVPSALPTS
ncbi:NPCBM/NEW2 domain-containing protein [Kribbella sp. NPDC049584]|uniref:NPCBM/NEW2 domain-containing protein n=1 Tax=Kribbella sp. NPDC049584 TaxID=3154833 RepID=UPI003441D91D